MTALDRLNHAVYSRPDVLDHYAAAVRLQPAEQAVADRFGAWLSEARLLDLGIGGGRTTACLAHRVRGYVGVDYVPEFVERARLRFPGTRIEVADARDLSGFAESSFDLVLFSFNGIDYVSHADRLRVLAEVHRVLAPGGRFWFSTHNREHARFGLLPWQGGSSLGRRTVRASVRALALTGRRLRRRRHEEWTPAYAIVNDDAHGYRLLTYYIAPAAQVRQLEEAGYADVVVHDGTGTPGVAAAPDRNAVWLSYLATRPAT